MAKSVWPERNSLSVKEYVTTHRAQIQQYLLERITLNTLKECWDWTSTINHKGYGCVRLGHGRSGKFEVLSHRLSAMLFLDFSPTPGICVLHKCDNPLCCKPDHLFFGTKADNNRDRLEKGRSRLGVCRGSACGRAILMEADVKDIRQRYATTKISMKQLAREYNVAYNTIVRAIHRETWKHVK
jgi:hypothetical protein